MSKVSDLAKERAAKLRRRGEAPTWWNAAMVFGGVVFAVLLTFQLMSSASPSASPSGSGSGATGEVLGFDPDDFTSPVTVPAPTPGVPGTTPPGESPTSTTPSTSTGGVVLDPDDPLSPPTVPTTVVVEPSSTSGGVDSTAPAVTSPPTTVVVAGDVISIVGPGSALVQVPLGAWDRANAVVAASQPGALISGAVVSAAGDTTIGFILVGVDAANSPLRAAVQVTRNPDGTWSGAAG